MSSSKHSMIDFHGEPTLALENRFLRLEYLAGAARIVRLIPKGKENLFADLGKKPIATPYGDFFFRGGHRLWHSPEGMPRSYIPDNEGAVLKELQDGVRIEMPPEPWTQIVKCMEIRLDPERAQVRIQHELRNEGAWSVEFAPWALTMFRLGGQALFPQPTGKVDEAGLLANRQLVLWPYARVDDPRLTLRNDILVIRAMPALPPLKIGFFNTHGWAAYWLEGTLFVKSFDVRYGAAHPDHGCNCESFCNDEFVELESLGPLAAAAPGETVFHGETWEIFDNLDLPFIPEGVREVIR